MDDKTISFDFPLQRTHCGVPLGNGNFGMQVWGKERLHLTVNRADFWDHRNGQEVPEKASYEKVVEAYGTPGQYDKFIQIFNYHCYPPPPWKSTRLPFGRFEFIFTADIRPKTAILSMTRGILTIEMVNSSGPVGTLTLAMDLNKNVVAVGDPDGFIHKVEYRTAHEWVGDTLKEKGIQPATPVNDDGLVGWIQALPDDPAMAGLCRRVEGGRLICLSRGDGVGAAKKIGLDEMTKVASKGIDALFAVVADWWKTYWESVPTIDVPEPFFKTFYEFAVYKFGAATAPTSPIPSGLQGPWAEEYQMTPWNGDYHFNVNIQQIYTLAFAINHPEHCLPLFDMLETEPFHSIMRRTAKHLFGIDDGLVITHAVDDRGRQVGGMSVGSVIDQACSGWTALLYWMYFQHTGDVEFLRTRAYPFIRGVTRAYEGMLEKKDGSYRIPISISAEYRFKDENGDMVNFGPSPSYQFACLHMLLDALFESCDILDVEPLESWRDIKENLPLYSLVEGEDGPRIAIWEGQDLAECHRHHSHLGCVYPFDSLGEMTEEKQDILDNSIDHWIGMGMGQWSEWCIPWAAIIQARMGFAESPRVLLNMWREVYVNEGMTTVYLPRFRGITAHRREKMVLPKETNEVMQLDGTMGGAAAILEMLVHCRRGVIRVFPAVAEAWKDVSFENVGVPGAARIAAERKNGLTQRVELSSQNGGTYRLEISDLTEAEVDVNGERKRVSFPASLILKAGERAVLTPV